MLFPMNAGGGGKGIYRRVVIANTDSSDPRTVNVASILPDIYTELTIDNFSVIVTSFNNTSSGGNWNTSALFNRYDAENGILYCNSCANWIGGTANKFYFGYTVVCDYVESTGGGGTVDPPALVDTVLWTNSSPTSDFSSQSVTLSDDIDNYDFLKFKWRFSTVTNETSEIMVSVSDFKAMNESITEVFFVTLDARSGASDRYIRPIFYTDDTHVNIWGASKYNGTGGYPSVCIPLQIIGVKKTSSPTTRVFTGTPTANGRYDCGFQPKTITIIDPNYVNGTYRLTCWYDADYSTSVTNAMLSGQFIQDTAIGTNSNIYAVDSTGFNLTTNYLSNYSSYLYIVATTH